MLPITGKDLSPILRGEVEGVYEETDTVGYELTGHSALFRGNYKLVRNLQPLGDGEWRLYNIVRDPGEVEGLKAEMPDRLQTMLVDYALFEEENGVEPIPPGYSRTRQLVINMLREQNGAAILIALLTMVLLIPFVVYVRTRPKS